MRVGSHVVRLSFTPERTQRSCISIASMDAQQRKSRRTMGSRCECEA